MIFWPLRAILVVSINSILIESVMRLSLFTTRQLFREIYRKDSPRKVPIPMCVPCCRQYRKRGDLEISGVVCLPNLWFLLFPESKWWRLLVFLFFLTAKLFYQLVYRIWKIWIRTNLKQKFATNVWPLLEMPSPSVRAVQHGFLSKRTKRVRMLANWMEIKLCHLLILKISPRDWVY